LVRQNPVLQIPGFGVFWSFKFQVLQIQSPRSGKQESQLLLGWTDRIAYIKMPASDFGSRKKTISHHARYGDDAVLNSRINTTLRCGNLVHLGDDCRQQCIQNCGQTAANKDIVTLDSL